MLKRRKSEGVTISKLILSLDGGGIRGAATTQFLCHVETLLKKQHKKSIRQCTDFYAGTSTGSIIALALATTDMDMSDINNLYNYQNANKIFSDNRGWFQIDGVNAPKYEGNGKTSVLEKEFGKAKLSNVPRNKHVLAVTYGVERHKPEVIKSTNAIHRKLLAYEVADASSAAPTYFPTKELEISDMEQAFWLIDGGVTANNPTMCAIAEAIKAWPNNPMNELRVLSIGTGYRTRKINGPASEKWGALEWFTKGHILDLLTDERVVAYQAHTIITPGNYIRVNAEMRKQPGLPKPPDDAMDDISKSNINKLKQMGDFLFEQYGQATVDLLMDSYAGPSLDIIDTDTGMPKIR
jgi:hypothetical protein